MNLGASRQQTKQVILIRKDLKMRRGKEIAQGAHASMMFLSYAYRNGTPLDPVAKEWIHGIFTKIAVRVYSEEELTSLVEQATDAGLRAHIVLDAGLTEFSGRATYTAAAIGPNYGDEIDKITGHLELY